MFLSPNLAKSSYGCINTWAASKVTKLEKKGKKFSAQAACGWWLENYRDSHTIRNLWWVWVQILPLCCQYCWCIHSCPDCYEWELCQAGWNGSNLKTLVGLGANSSPFVASTADVLLSRLVQLRTMPSLAQFKRFRNSQKSD